MTASSPADPTLPPAHTVQPGLYRHYKGGWYEVIDTVRCSETLQSMTLYRALYGSFGLWVRPAVMFSEVGVFQGQTQPRFTRHDAATVPITDLTSAPAVVAHLQGRAQRSGINLDTALRAAPPAPTACCQRGCSHCLWESYFMALQLWRDDAISLLSKTTAPQDGQHTQLGAGPQGGPG